MVRTEYVCKGITNSVTMWAPNAPPPFCMFEARWPILPPYCTV